VIPLHEPKKDALKTEEEELKRSDEKPCDLQHPEMRRVDPKIVAMQYRNELLRKGGKY
jgi:hypothetical protein